MSKRMFYKVMGPRYKVVGEHRGVQVGRRGRYHASSPRGRQAWNAWNVLQRGSGHLLGPRSHDLPAWLSPGSREPGEFISWSRDPRGVRGKLDITLIAEGYDIVFFPLDS